MNEFKLNTHYGITMAGMKAEWKIISPGEVVMLNGITYVKVCAKSYTLRKLLKELSGNADAGIATSVGYRKLIQLRNLEHKKLLDGETEQSNLFDNVSISRSFTLEQLNEQQLHRRAMAISLKIDDKLCEVTMLRPVRPRDVLQVEFSDASMNAVMNYITSHGFSDASPKKGQGAKGVHKHSKGYLVYYEDDDRIKRAKLIRGTIEDAMAFKADPSSWPGDNEEDGEDAEEEEHDDDAEVLETS
jgi:hypothetical protein